MITEKQKRTLACKMTADFQLSNYESYFRVQILAVRFYVWSTNIVSGTQALTAFSGPLKKNPTMIGN